METTGSATSPNTTLWLHISIHVRCGTFGSPVATSFLICSSLPFNNPITPEQPARPRCHYITQNKAITSNMCCLFHVGSSPLKMMGPHFIIPYSSNPQRKGYTPTPSLHTPLHSSSNGKAAASSRLKGLCRELPNALRTPLRGRRFLNKQHPQAFKPSIGVGVEPIPDFSYFSQGVSWLRGKRQGLKPWEFSPIVVSKPAFWFPGNFLTWQDLCELQQNKTETTADANGWRYSLDGWLSFAEKASYPIWWNPVRAEDCPEGHDG